MSNRQEGTIVEAMLKLQNMDCAAPVAAAVHSYFAASAGEYLFAEIRTDGSKGDELMLVFLASGQDHKEIADSVHQFLHSFMDEFYDDTLEDDWLNEMGCDEMPSIVSYEVNAAKHIPASKYL